MEPYVLPQKQPTPFPYLSPEDTHGNIELNDLFTGDEKTSETAKNDTVPENSNNTASDGDGLITIKGTDIPDESTADNYSEPEPIPTPKDKFTLDESIIKGNLHENIDKAHKTITDIGREFISKAEETLKEKETKQTAATERTAPMTAVGKGNIETEQIASDEEIISDSKDNSPFSDDIDSGQIDFAEEASSEKTEYSESTPGENDVNQT